MTASQVIARGVTIQNGAQLSFANIRGPVLSPGTVFTLISNTASTPIEGTFANLPNNSTMTSGGNAFHVSYQGGDGNDLTLTVLP